MRVYVLATVGGKHMMFVTGVGESRLPGKWKDKLVDLAEAIETRRVKNKAQAMDFIAAGA